MCHQQFLKYHCGHTQITSTQCPLSHDQPLYLLVDCPDYRIDSTATIECCGAGRFYCNDAPDGAFLNYLVAARLTAEQMIKNLEDRIRQLHKSCEQFLYTSENANLSSSLRAGNPIYQSLDRMHVDLQQRLQQARNQRDEAHIVLEHARSYFSYRQVFHLYCGTACPKPHAVLDSQSVPSSTSDRAVQSLSALQLAALHVPISGPTIHSTIQTVSPSMLLQPTNIAERAAPTSLQSPIVLHAELDDVPSPPDSRHDSAEFLEAESRQTTLSPNERVIEQRRRKKKTTLNGSRKRVRKV